MLAKILQSANQLHITYIHVVSHTYSERLAFADTGPQIIPIRSVQFYLLPLLNAGEVYSRVSQVNPDEPLLSPHHRPD